jgi:hypothetical protein
VALGLVLGRPIADDEFPNQIPALLEGARERSALGDEQPLSAGLRTWLARALQIDPRRAFASAPEALASLEEVFADESMYVAAPVALETFLSRYIASLVEEPLRVETVRLQATPAPAAESVRLQAAPTPATTSVHLKVDPTPAQDPGGARLQADRDPFTDLQAPPAAAVPELSALVDLSDLTVDRDPESAKPLFNPAEPFTVPPPAVAAAPTPPRKPARWIASVAVLVLLAGAGAGAYVWYGKTRNVPASGTLIVQSSPAGVQVFVDGVARGTTPARLSVPPGAHILELRGRGVPRVIPLTVSAGAQVSQYLEFAETPETGQLAIQSDPPGARVVVDGVDRGVAPITVQDLAPGQHEVVLTSDAGSVKHAVVVQAGAVASLVTPMTTAIPAGPVSGWLIVRAPFSVEIHEGGRLVGTTDADRLMLAAGKHELEFVNVSLGLRLARTVQVAPGKVTPLTLELPRGVVHFNATPWAEVWIDGERAGETPLGNVSLAIGPHEVVFRHPQLGEKRHAISVTAGAPVRVSVDMK